MGADDDTSTGCVVLCLLILGSLMRWIIPGLFALVKLCGLKCVSRFHRASNQLELELQQNSALMKSCDRFP